MFRLPKKLPKIKLNKTIKNVLIGLLSFLIVFTIVGRISAWALRSVLDLYDQGVFEKLTIQTLKIIVSLLWLVPAALLAAPLAYSYIKRKRAILIGTILAGLLIYALSFILYSQAAHYKFWDNINSAIAEPTMNQIFKKLSAEQHGRAEFNQAIMDRIHKMTDSFEGYEPLCSAKFNTDKANEWVSVNNPEGEISLIIPYNQSWGNEYIKLPPIEGLGATEGFPNMLKSRFGPLYNFNEGGCGWRRFGSITYVDQKSTKEVLNELNKNNEYDGFYSVRPTVKRLGDNQVVSSVSNSFCTTPSVEVIGHKHNYVISYFCGDDSQLPELEKIAASIKFLP